MMRQYARIKAEYQDAILFFRLGDFYEMFKSDAHEASRILGLTLTARNGVPMCGIPYHASHGYIGRLLRAGKKIAVCEQIRLSDDTKGIAEREVVEVITPGTVVEEDYLEAGSNNYLVAFARDRELLLEAYLDLSTGEFCVSSAPHEDAADFVRTELSRLGPREILVQESLLEEQVDVRAVIDQRESVVVNRYPDWSFDSDAGRRRLLHLFGVSTLDGFGVSDRELFCVDVLLSYVSDTARGLLRHVTSITVHRDEQVVILDETTQKNLELVQSMHEQGRRFSLLSVLDSTRTAMGARLLRRWLLSPLRDVAGIEERLDRVDRLYRNQIMLNRLRDELDGILDLERLAARIALERAHAKDLVAVRATLERALEIEQTLAGWFWSEHGITTGGDAATAVREVVDLLSRAIEDNPSVVLTEGNLIRPGYDGELDRLRTVRDGSRTVLADYLEAEKQKSGISALKLRHNRVIGYFFEVTRAHAGRVPEHFIRRQSMAQAERFTTEALGDIESDLNSASERIVDLEREIFLVVRAQVAERMERLLTVAGRLAQVDCLQSFAWAATRNGYVRPSLNEASGLRIVGGRHPVVERFGSPGGFVSNNLDLNKHRFALITGPNMAGKSTFLRQNALIVLMAQIGSFVPADDAVIGVCDRIFCRVGSSDNIARGQSTFLVEMSETANILRNASDRSLVIMDEVGRGTGTQDGLAIAWAVCEDLLERVCARTLFATHYHELTQLHGESLQNLSMSVAEEGNRIVFLRKVVSGPSSSSYGIHVAELAGLPAEVVRRAQALFSMLPAHEAVKALPARDGRREPGALDGTEQGELFRSAELILKEIESLDVNAITPVEALTVLDRWKRSLGTGSVTRPETRRR